MKTTMKPEVATEEESRLAEEVLEGFGTERQPTAEESTDSPKGETA